MCPQQEAIIRGFVKDLAERGEDRLHYSIHHFRGQSFPIRFPDYPITRSSSVSLCLCGRFLVFSAPPRLRGEFSFSITRSTDHRITRSLHNASSAYCVATKGDSCVAAWRWPEITLTHCSADSITITLTSTTKSPQTAASNWSLKIRLCKPPMAGPAA